MRKLFLSSVLLLCSFFCFAQDVPVDMYSGSPSISIPIWTITANDLSQNVSIFYSSTGLRLEDGPELIGLGWGLAAAGSVRREVRGLPDDYDGLSGSITDTRRGWLLQTSDTQYKSCKVVGDFTPTADNSSTTCTDETTDFNALSAISYRGTDTEPDVFNFNCGDLSGSFVFDNSAEPQIRLIPFQDVKIEYSVNGAKEIIAFKITSNDGVSYYFERPVRRSESTKKIGTSLPRFFNRYYNLYDYYRDQTNNGPTATQMTLDSKEIDQVKINALRPPPSAGAVGSVSFNSQWMLTRIVSPTGAFLVNEYLSRSFTINDTVKIGLRKPTAPEVEAADLYEKNVTIHEHRIHTMMSSTGQKVEFKYEDALLKTIQILDTRRTGSLIAKSFNFEHRLVYTSGTNYGRHFLRSVQEVAGCQRMSPHYFNYIGVNFSNNSTTLPSHFSKAKDLWGYFNGKSNSTLFPALYVYPALDYPNKVRTTPIQGYTGEVLNLNGANRNPDAKFAKIGSLASITFPQGGSLKIQYESNKYFDPIANQSIDGGGLRVKSLAFYEDMYFADGGVADSVYKEFIYEEDPGKSSGRLLNPPTFYLPATRYVSKDGSVTRTYSELVTQTPLFMWDRLIGRSEHHIGSESVVRYKVVTVKRQGSGYTRHEFDLPAIAGDQASGSWAATSNKFARSTNCETLGLNGVTGTWRFPFPPNPNFSHERGLPVKSTVFNEAGAKISETTTTYQYIYKQGSSATKVWGIAYELNPQSSATTMYGKYYLLTDVIKVPLTQTVITYDEASTARNITSTTHYTYATTNHRLLSSVTQLNSDGTIYRTKFRYPLDFGTIASNSEKNLLMIKKLQTDFRNGTVIEKIVTTQKPGGSEKTLTASLVTFNDFEGTVPLIEGTYALTTEEPLSDFSLAATQLQGAQYVLKKDNRYEKTNEILAYEADILSPTAYQNPLTGQVSGVVLAHNNSTPIASINFATPEQIAFSDFETSSNASFVPSSEIFGTGRTGKRAIHPSVTLTRRISKAPDATNYKLVFWIKTNGTALNMLLTIKNTSGTTLYTSPPISANSTTAGTFRLIEKIIPVASLPSTFDVVLSSQIAPGTYASGPNLLPVIDDVSFIPDFAEISSYTYEFPYGRDSHTDISGRTIYKTFDRLGREKLVMDLDKNIRSRSTHVSTNMSDVLIADFNAFTGLDQVLTTSVVGIGVPVTFVAEEDCHDQVLYEWNFGNGYVTGTREMTHSFNSIMSYTISLRVSKSGYTTVTKSMSFRVGQQLNICAEGVSNYNPLTNQVLANFPDCSRITTIPQPYSTVFHVGASVAGTIKWYIRDVGYKDWSLLSATTAQMTISDISSRTIGFEVKCQIVDGNIIKGESNVITVKILPI